jgi:hypothetical protein
MGITGTDWIEGQSAQGFLWEDWARGAGLAIVAILGVWLLWLLPRWVAPKAGLAPAANIPLAPMWRRLLDVFYLELHWAFYRSGPILWLGNLYWGTFLGAGLALLEGVLNPGLWQMLRHPRTAFPALMWLTTAWVSALLFLATQNLWIVMAAHLVLALLLGEKRTDAPSRA